MYLRAKKKTAREISLYEPIGTDKEGNEIHLLDIVEGGGEDIAEQYNRKEDAVRLYCYLDSELKEQEKQVLLLRYGLWRKSRIHTETGRCPARHQPFVRVADREECN